MTKPLTLDIFSELQRGEGMPESQLYEEAIEQAKLADEMGFGCWWTVEHHGTGEFSYASVPDMLLAVLANRFDGVVREMTNTMLRTGRSAVINSASMWSGRSSIAIRL